MFANIVWNIKQEDDQLLFKIEQELPHNGSKIRMKVDCPAKTKKNHEAGNLYPESYYENLLSTYFRLDVDLEALYTEWNNCHKHFSEHSKDFRAIRLLNQDPVENLFCFICRQACLTINSK